MSNDTPKPTEFHDQPWQVLIGIRKSTNPNNPSSLVAGLLVGLAADPAVCMQTERGPQPDLTEPAVHFANWLDRNKAHLAAMWETEFSQYLNLRMAAMRPTPGEPQIQIVGADALDRMN